MTFLGSAFQALDFMDVFFFALSIGFSGKFTRNAQVFCLISTFRYVIIVTESNDIVKICGTVLNSQKVRCDRVCESLIEKMLAFNIQHNGDNNLNVLLFLRINQEAQLHASAR